VANDKRDEDDNEPLAPLAEEPTVLSPQPPARAMAPTPLAPPQAVSRTQGFGSSPQARPPTSSRSAVPGAPPAAAPPAPPRSPTGQRQPVSDTLMAPDNGARRSPSPSGAQAAVAPAAAPAPADEPQPITQPPPAPKKTAPRPAVGDGDAYLDTVVADRYRVIRKLGEGGMGVVYLAEHVFIEKKVALKVLSEDFARKADLVARFMQEAKAASKIGHENIIDITDFGETASGSVFFAMEFLDGHDLAHHIREHGPMDFDRTRHIMNQICRALGAAHSKGIIHRDLKPENIYLIEREGKPDFVKVLDFGIAKISSFDEGGSRLTRTGMIFGTPEYMSPEQAKGDRPDHRVDIYAAGCILYEMLTGDVPFHAETFMGVLTKHMFENPEPPSVRAPQAGISPDVEAVVMKALAKDRDQRYQTMKEMALALEQCAGGDLGAAWGNEGSGVIPMSGRSDSSQVNIKLHTRGQAQVAAQGKSVTPLTGLADTLRQGPPKRRGVIYAVIGGLVPLAVVGVVMATRKPPPKPIVDVPKIEQKVEPKIEPKVEPPRPVAPSSYQISVRSEPSGADVFQGMERLGATPLTHDFASSTKELELVVKKKGYKDQKLRFAPDRNHDFVLPLQSAHHAGSAPVIVRPQTKPEAKPEVKPEAKPEVKPEAKPAGKLRDLKDPFAN